MKKFLMSFLILMVVSLAGCFGGSSGSNSGNDYGDNAFYAEQLEKVIFDAKEYLDSDKLTATGTVLEDGIYLFVEEQNKTVLYFYSMEEIVLMGTSDIKELIKKISVAAPNRNVHVVVQDSSVELFNYKSIQDTIENGVSPIVDPLMEVKNTGKTAGNVSAKTLTDEIPLDLVSPNGFTIVLKTPYEGTVGGIIDLVVDNSNPKEVKKGYVSEVSDNGLIIKVVMQPGQNLEEGKKYIPQINDKEIYFGSNSVMVPGTAELYVKKIIEAENGIIKLSMSRSATGVKASEFSVVETVNEKSQYSENVRIESINGDIVTLKVRSKAASDKVQKLVYKISYKNSVQATSSTVVILPLNKTAEQIINVEAENGKVTIALNKLASQNIVNSIELKEYVNGTFTRNIVVNSGNTVVKDSKIIVNFDTVTGEGKLIQYSAKSLNDNEPVFSNKFVIKGEEIITGKRVTLTDITVNSGESFDFYIKAEEFVENDVVAVEFVLNYDNTLLQVTENNIEFLNGFENATPQIKKIEGNTITLAAAFGNENNKKNPNGNIIKIKFKSSEVTTIKETTVSLTKVKMLRPNFVEVTGISSEDKGQIVIKSTNVITGKKVTLNTSQTSVNVGDTFEVTIKGSEFTEKSIGYSFYLKYDTNLIDIVSSSDVTLGSGYNSGLSIIQKSNVPEKGVYTIAATYINTPAIPNGDLLKIKFTAKAKGAASISFGEVDISNESNIFITGIDSSSTVNLSVTGNDVVEPGDMRLEISDNNTGALAVGEQFEITVTGKGFNGTKGNGIDIVLSYDSSVIELANTTTPLNSVTMLGVFSTNGILLPVDQISGKLQVVCTTGSPENFDTDLFKVKFVAKKNGTTDIAINKLEIPNSTNSGFLNVAKTDTGKIQVGETPIRELLGVTIAGDSSVAVGKTINLKATANYSEAPLTEDVTSTATWTSSSSSVASVSAGVVTGAASGSSTITAAFGGKTATKSITVETAFDGVIIYYKSTQSSPNIWLWSTGPDYDISTEMGGDWNTNHPVMTAVAGLDSWYEYKIPAAHITGGVIKVIFNKGSEVSRGSNKTGWYDGSKWTDECPDKPAEPTKPSISISPNGGELKGTSIITITITGENITSKSATFGGQTVPLTSNSASLTVADYIATSGGTGTLSVTATNDIGTETQTASFTRDDTVIEQTAVFSWDNAFVYFVLTDRFYDGDPSNNNSYNRKNSGIPTVATFHGGDIKGLTQKLDYIEELGINAIWITAPYEQIHGWVSGKDSKFPHYSFHGYYAQDWTFMDQNMGTIEEFRTFVNEAHSRDIRVVMDVVLNHTGYNTTEDMITYGFGETSISQHGWIAETNGKWDANVGNNWESNKWGNWWGSWVRGFGGKFGFAQEGSGDLRGSLAGLPDVVTESTQTVNIPTFLKTKWAAENNASYDKWRVPAAEKYRKDGVGAPADYIIKWLSAWVEEFGIDGFRCDTAKHVDMHRWAQLKNEANQALAAWRNSSRATGKAKEWKDNFWMTGEDFGHELNLGSAYYNNGFDSMINFSFNGTSGGTGRTPTTSDWSTYANAVSGSSKSPLSYVSSHDTGLHRPSDMKKLGTMLILLPGGVQVYYGDETARPGIDGMGDADMATRGFMNWNEANGDTATHWKKVGTFRKNHVAVGGGAQTDLGSNTYGRTYNKNGISDKVVIKIDASGSTQVNVSGIFSDGTKVRNAYNGETGTVSGGSVTFTAENGVILIEEM